VCVCVCVCVCLCFSVRVRVNIQTPTPYGGVATVSRIDKIIGLFGRILSVL